MYGIVTMRCLDGIFLGTLNDKVTGETMRFAAPSIVTATEWLQLQIDTGYGYVPYRELAAADPATVH